jgi:hypothetical protein
MKPANSPLNDRLRANQNCKALRPQFGYKILAFERVKSCLLEAHEIGSGFVSTYCNNTFHILTQRSNINRTKAKRAFTGITFARREKRPKDHRGRHTMDIIQIKETNTTFPALAERPYA